MSGFVFKQSEYHGKRLRVDVIDAETGSILIPRDRALTKQMVVALLEKCGGIPECFYMRKRKEFSTFDEWDSHLREMQPYEVHV